MAGVRVQRVSTYVTAIWPRPPASSTVTATVPALTPGLLRAYRIWRPASRSTTTTWWSHVCVGLDPRAGRAVVVGRHWKRGSQPGTQSRSPRGVNSRKASPGGRSTVSRPVSADVPVTAPPDGYGMPMTMQPTQAAGLTALAGFPRRVATASGRQPAALHTRLITWDRN